jgi:hypothetical protein
VGQPALNGVYAVIFLDAIVVKVRDGQVANRPIYAAIGVSLAGEKAVLGLWAATGWGGREVLAGRPHRPEQPRRRRVLPCLRRPQRDYPTWWAPCDRRPPCRPHLSTMKVARRSRRLPVPSRSGLVQTCCLKGPDADLFGRGGSGPCICQRE